jgi:hypothetical protein
MLKIQVYFVEGSANKAGEDQGGDKRWSGRR